MAITMQGNWTVNVKSKSAAYQQRFVIQGSDSADGVYSGVVSTPPVIVTGAQWTISIQHKPKSAKASWTGSAERLSTPVRSGGQISFDICSNDTGSDQDYNDLILTCSQPETITDYVLYGQVRTYSGLCKFNPCFPFYFVIDTALQLQYLTENAKARAIIEELYPERVRKFLKEPPMIRWPIPEPDPAPFHPMMIPMGTISEESQAAFGPRRIGRAYASFAIKTNIETPLRDSSVAVNQYSRLHEFARIADSFKLACSVKDQPGLLLRFLEYDRTADELIGGPYSGEGNRQILGLTVTDELGNYIFHFSQSYEDIAEEVSDVEASGPPLATQLRPDILVQVVSGTEESSGVLFETGLYENVSNLKRINLCIPEEKINPGPTACQGGRAIQAIGNIFTLPGTAHSFDADGRITANQFGAPVITRGAWADRLHMFACFLDCPQVKYYTIRHRRPSGVWEFVDEVYRHWHIPSIGLPQSHPNHKVGSFSKTLTVDGTAQEVPAYKNIEVDNDWVATHRLRKIILRSWRYAPNSDPGTVEFRIEGYNSAGNKVVDADDHIALYIDNREIDGDIDNVAMGTVSPGECALFELTSPNDTLTVRFKVTHPGGFLKNYHLSVIRGSNTSVAVSDTMAPVQPLNVDYNETTHGNFFFGTLNAMGPDSEGYVLAELQPNAGAWLPADKNFCAFAFEIWATPRITNGYSLWPSRRRDVELIGISYTPPAG